MPPHIFGSPCPRCSRHGRRGEAGARRGVAQGTGWDGNFLLPGAPPPAYVHWPIHALVLPQVSLEQYRGKYVILFFYPKDFT